MAKSKKKVGRPPSKPPEPIPDSEKNIIATVVATRDKDARKRKGNERTLG